jgi:hypothetical protein
VLEEGRVRSAFLLGLLVIGALFSIGFSFAILLRYAAVFSHDVSEGLSGPLKAIALFMAVLFLALPLAGFMGWGYLPFWWVSLFFIFESRAEKTVSVVILVCLALSSLVIPQVIHQRTLNQSALARTAFTVASGATSAEGQAFVKDRAAADASSTDWALLSANLLRRSGRFDEAAAALAPNAATDVRFGNNAAALEFVKGNYAGAVSGFAQASEGSVSGADKATVFYNLAQAQQNTLAFDPAKESRRKGDALAAPLLARYDRIFSFDRDGSTLQAPPDLRPEPRRITAGAIPVFSYTTDNAWSRLTVMAVALLIFIPAIVKFRGAQSFSKQCPKCGTTFCWLCQTRSTSQDVCSQCHYMFVVKRGIPPAARAAKTQEITRYTATRALLHRLTSLAAPGAGHLAVGHFSLGLPLLLVWSISLGIVLTVVALAPSIISMDPLGGALKMAFGLLAAVTYLAAQAIKPKAPVVAAPPRRTREQAAAAQ